MTSRIREIKKYRKQPVDAWTWYVSYSVSLPLVALLSKTRIKPNHLTLVNLLLGTLSAYLFSLGEYPYLIIGFLVFHLAYVFDCADGQLARYKGMSSRFGAYLDTMCDNLLLFFIIVGVGWAAFNQGATDMWFIGAVALLAFLNIYLDYHYHLVAPLRKETEEKAAREATAGGELPPKSGGIIGLVKKTGVIAGIGNETQKIMLSFGALFNIPKIMILVCLGVVAAWLPFTLIRFWTAYSGKRKKLGIRS